MSSSTRVETRPVVGPEGVVFAVLLAISFSHFLNDTMQSLLPAIYPTLKTKFSLNFGQIGLLTFVFQVTASLLQPVVGMVTDKRPQPYSLAAGMGFTMLGLIMLSRAGSFRHAFGGGCHDRHRVIHFPSRVLARRTPFVWRPSRPRAVRLPGRRQFRHRNRPCAGRLHRRSQRPGQHPVVLSHRAGRNGGVEPCRPLVSEPDGDQPKAAARLRRLRRSVLPPAKVAVTMVILIALVFSKFFYLASISSYYYLLFDSSLRALHSAGPAHAVRLFGGGGPRHGRRRPDR